MCRLVADAPPAAYIVPEARTSATLRQDEPASMLLALSATDHGSPGVTPKLGVAANTPAPDFAPPERTESPQHGAAHGAGSAVRWGTADAGASTAMPEDAEGGAPYPDAVPSSPGSAAASARQSFENPLVDRAASPALQHSNAAAHRVGDDEAADSPKALAPARGRSTSGSRHGRSHRLPRKDAHALGGLSGESDTDVYEARSVSQSRKAATRLSHA